MECWPRHTDVEKKDGQYEGWPKTIEQKDNYGRKAVAYLPELKINKVDQVVQIVDETYDEIVYTIRIQGREFRPRVFQAGVYTIKVGEGKNIKVLENIKSQALESKSQLKISL